MRVSLKGNSCQKKVAIAGLVMPDFFDAHFEPEGDEDYPAIEIHAVLGGDGAYHVVTLECRTRYWASNRKCPEITSTVLRAIPVQRLLTLAVQKLVVVRNGERPTHLSDAVADIYRIAILCGEPPTEAVAERLGVSRATAARRVAAARESGLLGAVAA